MTCNCDIDYACDTPECVVERDRAEKQYAGVYAGSRRYTQEELAEVASWND